MTVKELAKIIEKGFDDVNNRLDGVDKRFDDINKRIDNLVLKNDLKE